MGERRRIVVDVSHGDTDEGLVAERAVARLHSQRDRVASVCGVAHVDGGALCYRDLARVRVDAEDTHLVALDDGVSDFRGLVAIARLHPKRRLELLGALVDYSSVLLVLELGRTVVRVGQAQAQRDARCLALATVVRSLCGRDHAIL